MAATFCRKIDRNRRTIVGGVTLAIGISVAACLSLFTALTIHAQVETQADPSVAIRSWLNQLADSDPQVREQARDNLMGLKPGDLPTLRKVVADSADNLLPCQKTYLHDIVKQIFLFGLEYVPAPESLPFMGVQSNPDSRFDDQLDPSTPKPIGAVIIKRVQGFAAYRLLRDGDSITEIEEAPQPPLTGFGQLTEVIKHFKPGDTLTLRVIRGGKTLRVAIPLAAKPADLVDMFDPTPWFESRDAVAEAFWKSDFQPIVKDDAPPMLDAI